MKTLRVLILLSVLASLGSSQDAGEDKPKAKKFNLTFDYKTNCSLGFMFSFRQESKQDTEKEIVTTTYSLKDTPSLTIKEAAIGKPTKLRLENIYYNCSSCETTVSKVNNSGGRSHGDSFAELDWAEYELDSDLFVKSKKVSNERKSGPFTSEFAWICPFFGFVPPTKPVATGDKWEAKAALKIYDKGCEDKTKLASNLFCLESVDGDLATISWKAKGEAQYNKQMVVTSWEGKIIFDLARRMTKKFEFDINMKPKSPQPDETSEWSMKIIYDFSKDFDKIEKPKTDD